MFIKGKVSRITSMSLLCSCNSSNGDSSWVLSKGSIGWANNLLIYVPTWSTSHTTLDVFIFFISIPLIFNSTFSQYMWVNLTKSEEITFNCSSLWCLRWWMKDSNNLVLAFNDIDIGFCIISTINVYKSRLSYMHMECYF